MVGEMPNCFDGGDTTLLLTDRTDLPEFVSLDGVDPYKQCADINEKPPGVQTLQTLDLDNYLDKRPKNMTKVETFENPKLVELSRPPNCRIPRVQTADRIVEVPKIHYVDRIVEIPQVQTVDRIVEVPRVKTVEKIVEVPHIQYVNRIVEVPQIETIERIVEVPQIQYVDRVVEIPQIETIDKIVPKILTREVIREVPKFVVEEYVREVEGETHTHYIDTYVEKPIIQEVISEKLGPVEFVDIYRKYPLTVSADIDIR